MNQRKRRQPGPYVPSIIEFVETRRLMTASIPVLTLAQYGIPTISSVRVLIDQDSATGGAEPSRFQLVAFQQSQSGGLRGLSVGHSGVLGNDFEVWINDLTLNKVAFVGTAEDFSALTQEQLHSWLIMDNQFRVFVRAASSYGGDFRNEHWSKGVDFSIRREAELLSVHDAATIAEVGLRTRIKAPVLTTDWGGDWGLETYTTRDAVKLYEIEMTNRDTGQIYASFSLTPAQNHGQELSSFLPPGPVPPGRYSVRMRTLETFRETETAQETESWTDWSVPQNFNIYVAPVSITNGGGNTLDATPRFDWAATPDADSYDVWIGKPRSNVPVYSRSGIRTLSHSVASALPNGDYEVFVRARLTGGGFSQWGKGLPMTIGAPLSLSSPSAGVVSWTPVPGASRYEIWADYLGGAAPAGSRAIHELQWQQSSFSIPADKPAGRYRVWVRAIFDEGNMTYRSTWSASIDVTVAAAFVESNIGIEPALVESPLQLSRTESIPRDATDPSDHENAIDADLSLANNQAIDSLDSAETERVMFAMMKSPKLKQASLNDLETDHLMADLMSWLN